MSASLQVHLDDDDGAVCSYGPVIYVVWRDSGSTSPIDAADAAIDRMCAEYGEDRRLFYLHRAPDRPGMHRTDSELRKATLEHFARHESRFAAAALAIEASGFGGAVLRSITAGVLLVRPTRIETESFKDARAGVRWLMSRAGEHNRFDGEAMIEALTERGLCLSS